MRREVGSSAGLVALLALFFHMQAPNSESGTSTPRSSNSSASTKRASEAGDRADLVDGPWLATRALFHVASRSQSPQGKPEDKSKNNKDFQEALADLTSSGKLRNPEFFRQQLGLPPSSPEMFSIVATVADPSHTHMALFLDQQTEAIERSVQDAGWDFAAQWLPWIDRFEGNESDITLRRDQRRVQRDQEELPGILVFRSSADNDKNTFPDQALFVFLVPETVTGGVNGPAFHAAMHLANMLSQKANGKGQNAVGLLGPSFSGSFSSLSKLVRATRAEADFPAISDTVYGGTVSNQDYATAFAHETKKDFHGGILNSFDNQRALCTVLGKYHLDDRAAVIREDEGGLQRSIGPDPKHSVPCLLQTYVFTREISHLRNAYQDVGGDAAKDPYLDQPGRVNFSIRDPNSGEDSIPTFSESQTPLTQDTILSSITDELNRQHIHAVFISVTNPLDALFLLQALHAACPDIRVFIEGPNVLYVAAAQREALGGALFLSPYPMFFEGDDWLECTKGQTLEECNKAKLSTRLMFPESEVQGLYNVTQFLLTDINAEPKGDLKLRGYRQTGTPSQPFPGVWVLTLNRFGFLPIDLVPQTISPVDSNAGEKGWFKAGDSKVVALPAALDPMTAPLPWMLTVFIVSVAVVLACFTFVRCNISTQNAKPTWLVINDGYTPRFGALLCACLSAFALEWFLALPWFIPWRIFFSPGTSLIKLLRVSIVLGFAAPASTLLFTLFLLRKQITVRNARLRGAGYYAMQAALFGFGLSVWFRLCSDPDTGLFFRFRALELYSGSSPALPLAVICLIFLSMSMFHLKQHALAGLARPRLNVDDGASTSAYRKRFKDAYESIKRRTTAPWTLGGDIWVYRIVTAVVFALTCFVILGRSTRAFELQPYNQVLIVAILAILVALATKCYDLLTLWGSVRKLLALIQILPLRPAIQRVAEEWPKRPIWAFHRSVSKEAVEREMLYSLHRRVVILKSIDAEFPRAFAASAREGGTSQWSAARTTVAEADNDLKDFQKLIFGPPTENPKPRLFEILTGQDNPAAYSKLEEIRKHQEHSAALAAKIYDRDLGPAWRESLNDDNHAIPDVRTEAEGYSRDSLHRKYVDYCADFVALQFCRFIAYAVGQIKRTATSLLIIFVLFALLFNSYNPEGSQLVARFICVLFLVMGAAIWHVFSQMERNPILSTIAHTTPGELSGEFWVQLFVMGGLPLLGVLGHLFPSFSHFLFQWVAPSLQATR